MLNLYADEHLKVSLFPYHQYLFCLIFSAHQGNYSFSNLTLTNSLNMSNLGSQLRGVLKANMYGPGI